MRSISEHPELFLHVSRHEWEQCDHRQRKVRHQGVDNSGESGGNSIKEKDILNILNLPILSKCSHQTKCNFEHVVS